MRANSALRTSDTAHIFFPTALRYSPAQTGTWDPCSGRVLRLTYSLATRSFPRSAWECIPGRSASIHAAAISLRELCPTASLLLALPHFLHELHDEPFLEHRCCCCLRPSRRRTRVLASSGSVTASRPSSGSRCRCCSAASRAL